MTKPDNGCDVAGLLSELQVQDAIELSTRLGVLSARIDDLRTELEGWQEHFGALIRALLTEGAHIDSLRLIQDILELRGGVGLKIREYASSRTAQAQFAELSLEVACRGLEVFPRVFADDVCEELLERYVANRRPILMSQFGTVLPLAIVFEGLRDADRELLDPPSSKDDLKELIGAGVRDGAGLLIPITGLLEWFFNRVVERKAYIRSQMAAAVSQYARLQIYKDALRQLMEDTAKIDDAARESRGAFTALVEDCAVIVGEMSDRRCWANLRAIIPS